MGFFGDALVPDGQGVRVWLSVRVFVCERMCTA